VRETVRASRLYSIRFVTDGRRVGMERLLLPAKFCMRKKSIQNPERVATGCTNSTRKSLSVQVGWVHSVATAPGSVLTDLERQPRSSLALEQNNRSTI
jgi:hypothetical protein